MLAALLLLLPLMPFGGLRAQSCQWGYMSSSPSNQLADDATITAALVDAAGNTYIGGYFNDDVEFSSPTSLIYDFTAVGGDGDEDGFVAKLDPIGRVLWARQFEGSSSDQAEWVTSLALDQSGNLLVAGWFTSRYLHLYGASGRLNTQLLTNAGGTNDQADAFVIRLSPDGFYQSYYTYSSPAGWETFDALAVMPNGTIVAGGRSGLDIAVARWPVSGSFSDVTVGSAGFDFINDLKVDAAGNVVIVGGFRGASITFGTQPALTNATANNAAAAFVARLNGSNQWTQAKTISTNNATADVIINGLTLNAAGVATVVGYFTIGQLTFGAAGSINHLGPTTTKDGFIARLNTVDWIQRARIGGAGEDNPTDVALDASGNAIVVGRYTAPATFGGTTLAAGSGDTFIGRWDGAGNWQGLAAGAADGAGVKAVAVGGSGQISIAGDLSNCYTFGSCSECLPSNRSNIFPVFAVSLSAFPPLATPGDLPAPTFTLAPNPAHDQVRVELAAEPTALPLVVLDALGRTVRHQTLPAQTTTATLDVAGLPAGVYIVRCGQATHRLVIE